jgi:hypothetical protein
MSAGYSLDTARTAVWVSPKPPLPATPKADNRRARRPGRPRKLPMVAMRVAGMRGEHYSPWQGIYSSATTDLGELGEALWYRMRDTTHFSRADCWRISAGICGERIYLAAVIDDFGDLIVVSGA